MMNNSKLNALSKRLDVLCGEPPPAFEQFAEMWQSADPLSRSLFEMSMTSPDIVGRPRHYELIKKYLTELGVKADDPLDLEQVLSELQSDD